MHADQMLVEREPLTWKRRKVMKGTDSRRKRRVRSDRVLTFTRGTKPSPTPARRTASLVQADWAFGDGEKREFFV